LRLGFIRAMSCWAAAFAAVLGFCAQPLALAHGYKNGTIEVKHPWMMANATTTGIISLKLKNVSDHAERLLSATAKGSSARLRVVPAVGSAPQAGTASPAGGWIDIPAGQTVELSAKGAHIVAEGLPKSFAAYDRFAVTLVFANSRAIDVEVMVEEHSGP